MFRSWEAAKEAGKLLFVSSIFFGAIFFFEPPLTRLDFNTSFHFPPHVLMPGFVPDGIAWLIECGRKVDVTDDEAQPTAGEVLNL